MVPKTQSFLPSELRAAKAIDNTVNDLHRGGPPSRQRDTDLLRPDARTLAAIAGNPAHPLHGVTDFGLGHDEQTPERIDDLNAFHRTRGREISILQKLVVTAGNCLSLARETAATSQGDETP